MQEPGPTQTTASTGAAHPPGFVRASRRALRVLPFGVVAGVATTLVAPWSVAVLLGWCVAAWLFVTWTVARLAGMDGDATQAHARAEDDSRGVTDLILLIAALSSLAGIGLVLVEASSADGWQRGVMIALTVVAVAGAWAVVQTVFTLRYAHCYYAEQGGVDFNEEGMADYHDFTYLAVTVGMTFQVSDTDITSKSIRRLVTRHALISYVFGAVLIAMTINIVAGLVNS